MGNIEWIVGALVHKFLSHNDLSWFGGKEDLMQEARIAAWRAVLSYQSAKKAKLSSYVFECVKNRLVDLSGEAMRRIKTESLDEIDVADWLKAATTPDVISEFEQEDLMHTLLNQDEMDVYREIFKNDLSKAEVAKKLGLKQRRVNLCFTRILQKYRLNGQSPVLVST